MPRILQFCLHKMDNLGDTISHEVLRAALVRMEIDAEVDAVDIWEMADGGNSYDDRVDEINRRYDCIVIGSGGLLSPWVLNRIFADLSCWGRLTPPLVLFGIGIIKNEGVNFHYGLLTPDETTSSTVAVLRAASVVAIRDLRTLLLAQRIRGGDERIFLTGCPSMQFVQKSGPGGRAFLLNLPLDHDNTSKKASLLAGIGRAVVAKMEETLWLCHSEREEHEAQQICKNLKDRVQIVRPRTLDEISAVIAASAMGIVVKAHPAIFMLANLKPFASIAYDMKCLALLEMILDDPGMLLVPLSRLSDNASAGKEIGRLIQNLTRHEQMVVQSMTALREHFDREYAAFETAFSRVLGKP